MLLKQCFVDILYNVGGIAQLGERLHGMQEVSGSIPLFSTITRTYKLNVRLIKMCFVMMVERPIG